MPVEKFFHFISVLQHLNSIPVTCSLKVHLVNIDYRTFSRRIRTFLRGVAVGEYNYIPVSPEVIKRIIWQVIREVKSENAVIFEAPYATQLTEWTYERDAERQRGEALEQGKPATFDELKPLVEIVPLSRYAATPVEILRESLLDKDVFLAILLLKDRGYTPDSIIRLPRPTNYTFAELQALASPFPNVMLVEDNHELLIM